MISCNKAILCSSIFNNRILRTCNRNIFNASYVASFVNGNFGNMGCITISTIGRSAEFVAQSNLFISCISINFRPSVTRTNRESVGFSICGDSNSRRLASHFIGHISALSRHGNIRPSVLVDFTATSDSIFNSFVKRRQRLLQCHIVRNITTRNRGITS